jgi:DNA-binding transcriptional MerR regulator
MDSMEFVMGNSLETLPKTIDFNFEDLKTELGRSLSYYNGLVVTEDDIKSAKEDRAKLNKLRETLENKRKEVKKECMAPYTDFENKVKELVGLIDKPILAIDTQLKDYEDKRRAAKRADILAIYEDTVGELRALLPFDKLWRDEWYNTGVSMKKIREAIVASEDKTASDLEVLSTVESEFADPVKLKYLEALDLNAALSERARLQQQAARLREYEQQRARAEEAERLEKASVHPAPVTEVSQTPYRPEEPETAAEQEPTTEKVYLLRFECQVTIDQAKELSAWLKDRNISYRRV